MTIRGWACAGAHDDAAPLVLSRHAAGWVERWGELFGCPSGLAGHHRLAAGPTANCPYIARSLTMPSTGFLTKGRHLHDTSCQSREVQARS